MNPLERLMHDATAALEQFLDLLCLDDSHVSPSFSQANNIVFLDLVITTSARDELVLRNAGADNAFAVLARVMGDQSGLATVSIQIA